MSPSSAEACRRDQYLLKFRADRRQHLPPHRLAEALCDMLGALQFESAT